MCKITRTLNLLGKQDVERGMDIRTVQYLMGYNDIKATIRVYNHTNLTPILQQFCAILQKVMVENQGKTGYNYHKLKVLSFGAGRNSPPAV